MADASGDLARVKSELDGRNSRGTTGAALSRDVISVHDNINNTNISARKSHPHPPLTSRWSRRLRRRNYPC
jgi:hypothetical protein